MRDGKLNEVDRLARQRRKIAITFNNHRVVAIREVANDQGSRVHAAARWDAERVHVRRRDAIKRASRVLVDGFNVVVDLNDLDINAILFGPFVHDAAVFHVTPWHPSDIDRPRDPEFCFLLRRDGTGGKYGCRQQGGHQCGRCFHRSNSQCRSVLIAGRATDRTECEKHGLPEHCSPGFFPRRVLVQNLLPQRQLSDLTRVQWRRNPSCPVRGHIPRQAPKLRYFRVGELRSWLLLPKLKANIVRLLIF